MESFNEVYNRMLSKYTELTGVTPSAESDIAIRLKLLAGEIVACQMNLDFIKNQAFIETATGEYLDYHGASRGLTRKGSIKAKGVVAFKLETELTYTVSIPKGTLVATTGADTVTYETDIDTQIDIGRTLVSVPCTAIEGGRKGNAKATEVNVLVDSIADIHSVSNKNPFSGGVDAESDEDFRARILQSVKNVSNGTNTAYYKKLALSVEGVSGASVVALGRGAGTVDVYICSYGEKSSDKLVASVQELINNKREINADVKVFSATPYATTVDVNISVENGYDFETVSEQCTVALQNFISNLDVGEGLKSAQIAEIIYHIDGVENYSIINSDTEITQDKFIKADTINIGRM